MSPEIISLIGVLIGLALFMYLAYRGFNVLFLGIGCAVVVAIFGGMNPAASLTGTYSASFVDFWQKYMMMFVGGALFARMMADSGAAFRIAMALSSLCKRFKSKQSQQVMAVLTLPIINSILTYGGITSFLVVFLMVAIGRELFEELNIPWKMYGCACLGTATFTAAMLPGSPGTTNLIPTRYLGTDAMAGATLGILSTILCIVLGVLFIIWEVSKANKRGEGFLPTGEAIKSASLPLPEIPNFPIWQCLLPCVVLLGALNVFKLDIVISLALGCACCYLLFFRHIKMKDTLGASFTNAVSTLALVCAANGFGGVVAASPAYGFVIGKLNSITGLPPAFQIFICMNVAAGITGSSQGGLAIVLSNMGEKFLSFGIPAGAVHRLCSISAVGLDTLPHSVGVVNAAGAARLPHTQIYYYFFVISVVITLICGLFTATLITMGIGV